MGSKHLQDHIESVWAQDEWAFCTCTFGTFLRKVPQPGEHTACTNMGCKKTFAVLNAEYAAKVIEWVSTEDKAVNERSDEDSGLSGFPEEDVKNATKYPSVRKMLKDHIYSAITADASLWDNAIMGKSWDELAIKYTVKYEAKFTPQAKGKMLDEIRVLKDNVEKMDKLKAHLLA